MSEGEFNIEIGDREIDVDGAIGRFWRGLKGLFGGGGRATDKDIEKGREAVVGIQRGLPKVKSEVEKARARA